ncbi:MAG: MarR family transcriptional regulator [Burkholderiaceae bacterium]|nr:MarR family transcriptional regulator [Burkholderiaceae bacterium]
MKLDFTQRPGFLFGEVARLYGKLFEQQARNRLTLSRAQYRALAVLTIHGSDVQPMSQSELAERLDVTPMAVATLCDRMAAAGLLRREPHPTDRRVNLIRLQDKAEAALASAIALGDELERVTFRGFSKAERQQFLALLMKLRDNLDTESA